MALSLDAAAEVFREAMRDTVKRYALWYLIQGVLLIATGFLAIIYPVLSLWLYLHFTLSFRDPEELLTERGLELSDKTVRRGVAKFAPLVMASMTLASRGCRATPSCSKSTPTTWT